MKQLIGGVRCEMSVGTFDRGIWSKLNNNKIISVQQLEDLAVIASHWRMPDEGVVHDLDGSDQRESWVFLRRLATLVHQGRLLHLRHAPFLDSAPVTREHP
jgi:hypothetical protein